MNDIYPNKTISRCQSLASNKNFICADCTWSRGADNYRAYCSKEGFECNGHQMSPVMWCMDFELKDSKSTESPSDSGSRKESGGSYE